MHINANDLCNLLKWSISEWDPSSHVKKHDCNYFRFSLCHTEDGRSSWQHCIIQQQQIQIKLGWALFVTYTIIQSIMRSEMCSLHLTHPSAHTWSSGQPTVQRPGSSRGLPAGARTHNLGLPRVSSPTLYPLGQRLPSSLHLTHPKRIRTWSSGQPSYGARGAVRGSVPCSRALQSWYSCRPETRTCEL